MQTRVSFRQLLVVGLFFWTCTLGTITTLAQSYGDDGYYDDSGGYGNDGYGSTGAPPGAGDNLYANYAARQQEKEMGAVA
jgi:hypothetical protein